MSEPVAVAKVGDIPVGEGRSFPVSGTMVAVFHVADGEYRAINDFCPHMGASLATGHYEDGAVTCQFEQAIRAATGHRLGDARRLIDCEMTNLIGADVLEVPQLLEEAGLRMHLYGKTDIRPGRKMGHVNRVTRR